MKLVLVSSMAFLSLTATASAATQRMCFDAAAKAALKTTKKVFEIKFSNEGKFEFAISNIQMGNSEKINRTVVTHYLVTGAASMGAAQSVKFFTADVSVNSKNCKAFKTYLSLNQ